MDEKRQEEVMHAFMGDEALGGGSVMAAYKDALKYLDRSSDETVNDIHSGFEKKGPAGFMAAMAISGGKLDAAVETVAFVFGKTVSQVRHDLMELVFGEEH